jgi:isopenicillin-N N-acyltransferase like protein
MPEKKKKNHSVLAIIIIGFSGLIMAFIIYFNIVTRIQPPRPNDRDSVGLKVENPAEDFYTCRKNWLKKSNTGLWELYLEGKPFERGVINGKLTKNLIRMQEEAFVSQIDQIVPSKKYQYLLKYLIYWFNRNLDRYLPLEYKLEIYGISLSASGKFSFIGSNYQRLLNYHSAHDIGHALQNFRLVGCTSFGVWDAKSKDSALLIGRNFDFYAGEDFARNKIVCFEKPDLGYAFMMITWGGMIGTVSGMNEKGLTVTINAATSDVPYAARMPISILAREILQYAKSIDAAYAIAKSRETFVSESILIGSAEDNRAAIIEKSPSGIALYDPKSDYIVCTNHFQSKQFQSNPEIIADMKENASLYRYKRVVQDITNQKPFNERSVAALLRDQEGLNDRDIGMGNEKAINQLIAHHSVIFKPSTRQVWVSTGNWQLGPYVCYDLKKIFHKFAGLKDKVEIIEQDKSIPPDPFFVSEKYQQFKSYKEMKQFILNVGRSKEQIALPGSFIHEFIETNPQYYEVYSIVGDYYSRLNQPDSSILFYRMALGKEIPRQNEKMKIISKLSTCIIKVKKERK